MAGRHALNVTLLMKHLILLFVICVGVAVTGCERFTDYDFTLRNATSATTIRFQSTETEIGPIDTTLQPGAQVLLMELAHLGVEENPPPIGNFLQSILVTSAQGDTCLRDPNANSTWTAVTELTNRRPKLYFHHYTLEIKDSDF
jgi:hypothetical protein